MIPDKVLDLCIEHGDQLAAMARNYRAARSEAHRTLIENSLTANFTGPMWLTYYQSQNGAKGGAVSSEAKTAAVRENGRKGGLAKARKKLSE